MKILTLIAMIFLISSASAGEIINRKNNESISFKIDPLKKVLTVKSSRLNISQSYHLEVVKQYAENLMYQKRMKVMPVSDLMVDSFDSMGIGGAGLIIIPGINLAFLTSVALDVITLPLRLPIKFLKESAFKKDSRVILSALQNEDGVESVGNKSFRRIEGYLFPL